MLKIVLVTLMIALGGVVLTPAATAYDPCGDNTLIGRQTGGCKYVGPCNIRTFECIWP